MLPWPVYPALNPGPYALWKRLTELQAQFSTTFFLTLLQRLTVLTLILDSVNMTVSFTYTAQNIKGTRDRTLSSLAHEDYCIWFKQTKQLCNNGHVDPEWHEKASGRFFVFVFCSVEVGRHGLVLARLVLSHWTTFLVWFFFSLPFFSSIMVHMLLKQV